MGVRYRRVLAFAPNPGLSVRDAYRIKRELARYLGRPVSVRVSRHRVEVDASDVDREDLAIALGRVAGLRIESARTSWDEEALDAAQRLERFAELFSTERYWEAHEVLEPLWRLTRDFCIQELILAAASLAKTQEGSLEGAMKILERIPGCGAVDVGCLRNVIIEYYNSMSGKPLKCINSRYLTKRA